MSGSNSAASDFASAERPGPRTIRSPTAHASRTPTQVVYVLTLCWACRRRRDLSHASLSAEALSRHWIDGSKNMSEGDSDAGGEGGDGGARNGHCSGQGMWASTIHHPKAVLPLG
eukprot:scaffold95331_cov69-Phaeocystis_antarctica.AAC.3